MNGASGVSADNVRPGILGRKHGRPVFDRNVLRHDNGEYVCVR